MLKLTVVRKQQGLTQAKLAKLAGMSAPQLSAIENKRIYPWEGWQRRIADALSWKGEPSDLFNEVEV